MVIKEVIKEVIIAARGIIRADQTHRLLIQVLQADRRDAGALMQGCVERAAALREEAEAQARRGQHEAASKGLEDSTRELLRAIRAGGLYVPG